MDRHAKKPTKTTLRSEGSSVLEKRKERTKNSKKSLDRADTVRDEWSRGVARWFRCSLSVSDSFGSRCLTSSTMLPFPHPAHRTGRADLLHPALGERSRCRPRETTRPRGEADEAQHFVQGCFGKPPGPDPN